MTIAPRPEIELVDDTMPAPVDRVPAAPSDDADEALREAAGEVASLVREALPTLKRRRMTNGLFSVMNLAVYGLLAVASLALPLWACLPIWLLQGVVLVGFSNAAHECTHGNATESRTWNRVLGSLWMAPLMLNFGIHRNYHLLHHRITTRPGDPEADFEYGGFPSLRAYLASGARWITLITSPLHHLNWRLSVKCLLGGEVTLLPNAKERRHTNLNTIFLLAWVAALVALTVRWPGLMLRVYFIPAGIFLPFVAWFTALPEHYGTEIGKVQLRNTRTVDAGIVLRHLFWYFNYHTAHHVAPSVPFYHLPKLDEIIRARIPFRVTSYRAFHLDLIRTLRARGGTK